MRRRKNLIPLFILTLLSWAFLIYFILNISPEARFTLPPIPYTLNPIPFFFLLVFLASFSFFSLVLNKTRWGLLLGLGIVIFLLLRVLKLTHPFYLTILMATLLALEFTFRKN